MTWATLLSQDSEHVLPWIGGRSVHSATRSWSVAGRLPREHGWHRFQVSGSRRARWLGPAEADPCFDEGRPCVRGYLVGDRLVPDDAAVKTDVFRVFEQTEQVWLVEPGLERFSRVLAARQRDGALVFVRQEFPLGPEFEVLSAWQDGLEGVHHIPGVPPALELAFHWQHWRKLLADERRAELALLEALEAEERERAEQWLRWQTAAGDAAARRALAERDFEAAARAALQVGGAELLDHRPSHNPGEVVVQYRFKDRRFESVVHAKTLRIIDAGICLRDYATDTRGDTRFTLESIVSVIDEAMRTGVLHIYRHLD